MWTSAPVSTGGKGCPWSWGHPDSSMNRAGTVVEGHSFVQCALGWSFLSREVGADHSLWSLPSWPILWQEFFGLAHHSPCAGGSENWLRPQFQLLYSILSCSTLLFILLPVHKSLWIYTYQGKVWVSPEFANPWLEEVSCGAEQDASGALCLLRLDQDFAITCFSRLFPGVEQLSPFLPPSQWKITCSHG